MIDKERIIINLDYIESITQNGASPNTDQLWKPIINMLSEDEDETKKFLSKLDEHYLNCITECFEEISYKLKSKSFVDFLEQLSMQHKEIDFSTDIKYARMAIEE